VLNDAVDGAGKKIIRRRRSWYRRRLRRRRFLVAILLGSVLAGACIQKIAVHLASLSQRASAVSPGSFWARRDIHKELAFAAAQPHKAKKISNRIPGVYPYSVVPGGVKSADDLRYAALRDYVVRRHYNHFDFSKARLERAQEAREVYLSYRIRDKIFWTRKKAHLRVGELLLTDGSITARAKCGNQISDTAKPEVSDEEPDEDVMDEPVPAVDEAPTGPIRPLLASLDLPSGQPVSPGIVGGPFSFPYVPIGLPIPSGKCPAGETRVDGHCKHKKPVAPEPSTLLLVSSGLALIACRKKACRKKACRKKACRRKKVAASPAA